MADANVSQLEINGTTYDICDATARDSLSQYVLKTGDTVTGTIVMKANSLDEDGDTPSSSNVNVQAIEIKDADNTTISHYEIFHSTGGHIGHNFASVRRSVDGIRTWHQCVMRVDTSGNVSYIIDTPSAFREAISAVSNSGDTMTGSLALKSTDMDRDGSNPSAQQWSKGIRFEDKDGETLGSLMTVRETDGRIRLSVYVNNEDTSGNEKNNAFSMYVAKDGARAYWVADQEAFCSAIGRGFSQATSGFTLNSTNISSVGNQLFRKQGRVVYIYVITTTKVSLAAGATKDIGTVPTGYGMSTRPAYLDCSAAGTAWIEGAQIKINPSNTIAASTSLAFSGCFII